MGRAILEARNPEPSPSPEPVEAPRRKRLRPNHSVVEEPTSTLEDVLSEALPDKREFFQEWIAALRAPSVCVTSLEDVRRLDSEDIAGLPVPPLVKGVFREILQEEETMMAEQQAVLEATWARKRAFLGPLRDRNMQPPLAGSKYFQDQKSYRLILAREEIEAGVRLVASRLEKWCKGERIVLVGILKGAFMFLSDLCRALTRPYSVYFVEASSYKAGRTQGGVEIASDFSGTKFCDATSQKPHKVVLIDELLDNGHTMQEMKQHFLSKLSATHTENDILTVCLFSKKRDRDAPEADITGIANLPDLWLVGYGLDDRGTKRGWTELFAMPKVKIVETVEKDEVDQLLAHLGDEAAVLTKPLVFAGNELCCSDKKKYRVTGLDIGQNGQGHNVPNLKRLGSKVVKKTDIQQVLAGVSMVKGKYEQELKFSFIQEGVGLVPEDDIFSGNNQLYAEMRCRLRKQIADACTKSGVKGMDKIPPE